MKNQNFKKLLVVIAAFTASVPCNKRQPDRAEVILRRTAGVGACTRENWRQHDHRLYPELRYGLQAGRFPNSLFEAARGFRSRD